MNCELCVNDVVAVRRLEGHYVCERHVASIRRVYSRKTISGQLVALAIESVRLIFMLVLVVFVLPYRILIGRRRQ